MSSSEIVKQQDLLFSMLMEIDRICEKHGIRYMLFAGTALGAVRHHDFIPWDDDLDVLMMREEYEKFLCVAGQELDGQAFFLQKEFSEHWPMFYSKLRKNGTAYMEKCYPRDVEQHQGVYVDIFPCDNLSDRKAHRKMQFLASKIVIARSLRKRGYLTDSHKKKWFMALCTLFPTKPFTKIVKNVSNGDSRMVHSFFGASSKFEKSIYQREWITETTQILFRNKLFPVSAHYDELLTCLYGDYMTLPPESKRVCKVHAMKIDLEHSYTEYIEWQRAQKIEVYTESIR